jgi:hypothetical protein
MNLVFILFVKNFEITWMYKEHGERGFSSLAWLDVIFVKYFTKPKLQLYYHSKQSKQMQRLAVQHHYYWLLQPLVHSKCEELLMVDDVL